MFLVSYIFGWYSKLLTFNILEFLNIFRINEWFICKAFKIFNVKEECPKLKECYCR